MAKKKVARKKTAKTPPKSASPSNDNSGQLQRPSAEVLYADELAKLAKESAKQPRPDGWYLPPSAVLRFILGDSQQGETPKFVGKRSFLERCIVSLATNRGLMPVSYTHLTLPTKA